MLIKALDLMVAKPEKIAEEADAILSKYSKRQEKAEVDDEIRKLASDKIIRNYSYMSGFSGGITALSGIVPGVGTLVAVSGGVTADVALCMKFQIEMVMAIAHIYDHKILDEEQKRVCFVIAGLGAINSSGQAGTKRVGSKAFTKLVQQYLKGPTLVAVKEVLKKVGITFTRKGLEKAIPFGIGSAVSFAANKSLTWYVGIKARDFFKAG